MGKTSPGTAPSSMVLDELWDVTSCALVREHVRDLHVELKVHTGVGELF